MKTKSESADKTPTNNGVLSPQRGILQIGKRIGRRSRQPVPTAQEANDAQD